MYHDCNAPPFWLPVCPQQWQWPAIGESCVGGNATYVEISLGMFIYHISLDIYIYIYHYHISIYIIYLSIYIYIYTYIYIEIPPHLVWHMDGPLILPWTWLPFLGSTPAKRTGGNMCGKEKALGADSKLGRSH